MSDKEKATRDKGLHDERKNDLAKNTVGKNAKDREKYFHDDDMSIDDMVTKEKLSKGYDYESNAVDNLSKKRRGPIRDIYGEEEEYGAGLQNSLRNMESRDKRMKIANLEDKAKKQQIAEYQKQESIHSKDRLNPENPRFPRHMLIAMGTRAYLMLKAGGRLCDGHCLIAPIQLSVSATNCDEDTLEEIRNFKKCLIRMFDATEKECVFIETAMGLDRHPHGYIECVPLPRSKFANAPMYFKKAINEAEDEFEAQNRALIDTRGVKKLATKIPKHMPYFAVDFGLQGGFAHVIENERDFSKSFGLDILAGILNVPADIVARQRSSIDEEKQLAMGFSTSFEEFDWTKALKE